MSGECILLRPEAQQPGARLISVSTAALCAALAIWSPSAQAQQPAVAAPEAEAVVRAENPTGRDIDLVLPLTVNQRLAGDLNVSLSKTGDVRMPVADITRLLAERLSDPALAELAQLGDAEGMASLQDLRDGGFDFRYHPTRLEIGLVPTPDQARGGVISASSLPDGVSPEDVAPPAMVSAYLNFRNSIDVSNLTSDGETERGRFRTGLDGAARLFDLFVVEAEGSFEEEDGFSREGTRLVYDHVGSATRWELGDVDLTTAGFQGGEGVFGLSVERRYGELSPRSSTAPSGRGRFRIERPSRVDVVVNGRSVRRLTLQPGVYDIEDLNLSQGSNDVQLIVEDLDGRTETLEFTLYFDRSLLATDAQEFGLSAGVRSQQDGNDIAYETDDPVASAYYRTGVTDELTLGVNAQSDSDIGQAGVEGVVALPVGAVAFDAAVSNSWEGGGDLGIAANLDYSISNFSFGDWDAEQRSFDVSVEYSTPEFSRVGGGGASDYWLTFDAAYRQSVYESMSVGLTGSYDFGRSGTSDRYRATVSSSYDISRDLSASASIGYEEELDPINGDSGADLFGLFGLTYRLGETGRVAASYDTEDNLSRLSYADSYGEGVGSFDWDAEVERSDSESGVSGSVGYTANRAELSLSHDSNLSENGSEILSDRTTARLDTALVFADGRVALSRPVSDSFAIISGHSSLEGRKVLVDPEDDNPSAQSDWLGPAVVTDLGSYSTAQIPYDVEDLPLGYDLGAGAFVLTPGYRSGYKLTVGSSFSVTVVGTLYDAKGEALPLVSGQARYAADEETPPVTVFTNRAGRFVAQGLKPGVWTVKMGGSTYRIEVPEDVAGLFKAGDIRPASP